MRRQSSFNFVSGALLFLSIFVGATIFAEQLRLPKSDSTVSAMPNSIQTEIDVPDSESRSESVDDSDNLTAAYQKGKAEAELDVRHGKLIIHFAGIAVPNHKFKETMLKNYGVTVITGGCTMTLSESKRIEGYDEVSRSVIEKRFGKGIIESVQKESQKLR